MASFGFLKFLERLWKKIQKIYFSEALPLWPAVQETLTWFVGASINFFKNLWLALVWLVWSFFTHIDRIILGFQGRAQKFEPRQHKKTLVAFGFLAIVLLVGIFNQERQNINRARVKLGPELEQIHQKVLSPDEVAGGGLMLPGEILREAREISEDFYLNFDRRILSFWILAVVVLLYFLVRKGRPKKPKKKK